MLNYITWTVEPEIFSVGPLTIRWYGLMWALAILSAWLIVTKCYKNEKKPEEWSDKLFIYGAVGLILGARLGHCLFYGAGGDFFYYYKHPLEILKIWEGGLSSHGGAFGLLVAMYLYNRQVTKSGYIWIFDRLVIGVALGGALIRFGNLMNSEIYGGPTTLPWGFKFVSDMSNCYGNNPCYDWATTAVHPTQIYEILYCLIAFAVCFWLYWKKEAYKKQGLIFGTFLIIVFLTRFMLEFIKNNQESFEDGMLLNMGQLLSLPFVIWGVWLLVRALKPKKIE